MSLDIERVRILALKKLAGESLTHEEQGELSAWLSESEENRTFYRELSNNSSIAKNTLSFRQLRDWRMEQPYALLKDSPTRAKRRTIGYWYLAATIVGICFATLLYLGYNSSEKGNSTVASSETRKDANKFISPARQRATLTINGQESYALDSIPVGKTFEGITKEANGELQYLLKQQQGASIEHRVSTPSGGFYNLTLSDGTRVMVNAASELTFMSLFSKDERRVRLSGEAFFIVSKDKSRPFIVETNAGEATVLGTQFDVKAYDKETMVTSLLEGSVKVKNSAGTKTRVLQPGNQALINPTGELKFVESADVHMIASWPTVFYFSDGSMEDLFTEIERWYGVKVIYIKQTLPKTLLNGSFDRTLPLEELVEVLQKVIKVKLKISGNNLLVQP